MAIGERLTPQYAMVKLAQLAGRESVSVLRRGELEVKYYRPKHTDGQTPHTMDEVYVIIEGTGNYVFGSESHPCHSGEVIFVPAGTQHRFEDFSDDFATWAIFIGPNGSERQ